MPGVESNALPLEEKPLHESHRAAVAADADAALRVHDAMPGEAAPLGQSRERVADEARLPCHSGQPRDLAVRCDATARNARDDRIDPLAPANAGGQCPL